MCVCVCVVVSTGRRDMECHDRNSHAHAHTLLGSVSMDSNLGGWKGESLMISYNNKKRLSILGLILALLINKLTLSETHTDQVANHLPKHP